MEVILEEETLWNVREHYTGQNGLSLVSPFEPEVCTRGLSGFFSHRGQSSQLLSAGAEPPWQAGTQSTGRGPFLPTITRAGTEMQSKDCDSELGEALGSLGFLGAQW